MSISPRHVSRFSHEFQLACACCRVSPSEADRREVKRLLALVDVPTFVDLTVERHRIGSIVYAALGRLPPQDLPPGLMGPLLEESRQNAVKALRAQRTHVLLARWFAAAAIDWLPFKGMTTALRYYHDASTRQVNDLDIWVSAGSRSLAQATLRDHGFRVLDTNICSDLAARGTRHSEYLSNYYHEEQYYSPEFGLLELHWRLADNPFQFQLAPESILADGDTIEIGGTGVRVMNDIDLLLYLCEHGGRHGWSRMKWLADLPQVLSVRVWDWPKVLSRARQAGCYQSLIFGLALSQDLLGWCPPPQVREAIASSFRLRIARRLVGQTWDGPAAAKSLPFAKVVQLVLKELALKVLLTNTLRAALHQIRRYLLSPNDLRVMRIPDRWFGLYYLMRPFTFLVSRVKMAWNFGAPLR